ncbi:Dehydrogenase (flavoprotein) [Friedmanniella luteola]|uniref:Dehydrogenase (Flavoprotein) n=1 Tax=Friedmanniella luteola TaxID=546871 RepID=A0A1H1YXF6_9ACTN|nr:FAD-binding protein [Friedmanniella luteola]SDT26131.1 Dehydrogenase (flavoprotein) [Friedmanniella luteola]
MILESTGRPPRSTVVVGASFAGLLAAAAAARGGGQVTVLERDELPDTAGPRRGVAQGRQPHVLLHRGLLEASGLLPGLPEDLVAAGAVRVDCGTLPWCGPLGWQPTSTRSYDVLSLTRPLLEHVVRARVAALPGVALRRGSRVRGLEGDGDRGWRVLLGSGDAVPGELVVDASGRGSRMPVWLAAAGHPVEEPETVDAALGYASRLYRTPDRRPLPTGVVVQPTPDVPRGGLGLPVENGGWVVLANGYGAHRPDRGTDLVDFFGTLRDPVLAELVVGLEPAGELTVHRQTGNRRHGYGRRRDWPDGLLVVGDALCAFNPLYGQGITVAAIQAGLLADAWTRRRWTARRVQSRLRDVTDLPWAVATSEDRRHLGPTGPAPLPQRVVDAWTAEVGHLLMAGDRHATTAFNRIYHLMGSPRELLHPALFVAAARRPRGVATPPPPRPPQLLALLAATRR